ncbi:histidine phosphatase family protein [Patescibacteria group bacterium]|nr:histidine phosphatase family protein [Patescibacteria group bacterium]
MKTLYLIRHGESEGNAQRIYQTPDAPLSPKGKEQARILKERFKHIPIEALYCSTLKRAQETAEIINQVFNLPIQATPLVNEWGKPTSLLGKEVEGEEAKEFHTALRSRSRDPYWKWQDEESIGEVRDRTDKFLKEMKRISQQNILVVMHSLPMKMMLSIVLYGPEHIPFVQGSSPFPVYISNTGITVFQLPEGKDHWELVTFNDHAHLGEA